VNLNTLRDEKREEDCFVEEEEEAIVLLSSFSRPLKPLHTVQPVPLSLGA
jgi:hypothetical protein